LLAQLKLLILPIFSKQNSYLYPIISSLFLIPYFIYSSSNLYYFISFPKYGLCFLFLWNLKFDLLFYVGFIAINFPCSTALDTFQGIEVLQLVYRFLSMGTGPQLNSCVHGREEGKPKLLNLPFCQTNISYKYECKNHQ
jgi:hypothetical protein